MAARKPKRKHSARASIQVQELSKAGTSLQLEIYSPNRKVGKLVIGRGSLTWFGNHWKRGRRFSWSDFSDYMERH